MSITSWGLRRADHDHTACARCGIVRTVNPRRPNAGLCRDCLDVARTLGEVTTWTA